ncbi:ABC transporter ATP-binding protein [Cohnella cholangitidis]|uniref:ABC transporter ATP-binding protein n=1 Tax=Cohnella cholangitidis TaxID=2598458 RepID=A0A7G5C2H6_9BACL|nr:ABC transporter ATP-binding protein [Cohnella cholangitidis]QMV43410.1 ABC transporter ATP-binding protein [Cohnella cholangitidis]
MNSIVEIKELTKTYGNFKAVDNVSFTLEDGKIYGLLGRNGAGKTTIMHMITAQLFKSGGEIKVFGEEPFENDKVLRKICFIKESQKYPDNFRVLDVLNVSPLFFPNWDKELAYSLIEDFRLPLKRRVKKLSRGMLSAVGIIVGLASRAPLTIFDEPYLGLDAVARSLFYNRLLEDYAEHPRTIVLSTHLIDEVSQLLEHVLVIDRGKLLLNEESEVLRGRASTVAGTAAKVEEFLEGKQVIHREPFAGLTSATVIGHLTAEDRGRAAELGLEISPVSLQQMVVHLTNSQNRREAGEVR